MTGDSERGYVELLIKVYRPVSSSLSNINNEGSEEDHRNKGGKMSQHMDALQLGQTIEVKGPTGNY